MSVEAQSQTTTLAGAATSGNQNPAPGTDASLAATQAAGDASAGASDKAQPGAKSEGDGKPAAKGSLLGSTSKEQGQPSVSANGAELEIKLPDGVQVDKAMLDAFRPVAAKLGLDSPKASELAGWYADQVKAANDANAKAWEEQSTKWEDAIKVDPEVGGPKLEASVAAARSAIERFGGQGLRDELDRLQIGNHPELFKAMVRIGNAIAEDQSHADKAAKTSPGSRAERLKQRYNHPDSQALNGRGGG